MGSSTAQLSFLVSLVSGTLTVATLGVLIFGIIKTNGTPRVLLLVGGALLLASRLSYLTVTPLLSSLRDRAAVVLVPQLVSGLLGLGATVCLVLAVVKAWQIRQQPEQPSRPRAYPQQTQRYPR